MCLGHFCFGIVVEDEDVVDEDEDVVDCKDEEMKMSGLVVCHLSGFQTINFYFSQVKHR